MIQVQADRNSLITEEVINKARGVTRYFIISWRIESRLHDDLYSAANLALIEASDKFDGRGAITFWNYAKGVVKGRVVDELRTQLGRPHTDVSRGHSDRTRAIKRAGELFEWDHPSAIDERYSRYVDRDFLLSLSDNPRTKEIILLKLAGYTTEEIGERLGIHSSRVSQIICKLYTVEKRVGSNPTWL